MKVHIHMKYVLSFATVVAKSRRFHSFCVIESKVARKVAKNLVFCNLLEPILI